MKNLIISLIDNQYFDVDRFFISLGDSGYDGHVCLFAGPNTDALSFEKLKKYGAEVIKFKAAFPYINNPHPDNFAHLPEATSIYNFRHYLYFDYLLKNQGCFANVLLTDVRDVVFQREPFSLLATDALHLAMEEHTIGSCQFLNRWLVLSYDPDVIENLSSQRVSCAGTTIGPTPHIMRYLRQMLEEMMQIPNVVSCYDQAMHNVLLHNGKLDPIVKMENKDGLIMTVSSLSPDKFRFDGQGYLLAENGQRAYVVHQGDRFVKITLQMDKFIFKSSMPAFASSHALRYFFKTKMHSVLVSKFSGFYLKSPLIMSAWRKFKHIIK